MVSPNQRLKVCAEPGCYDLAPTRYCEAHAPAPWASSSRRASLGGKSGWQQQRDAKRILRRFNAVCHWCKQPGATQVDHVIPLAEGGRDDDSNKRPIHPKPCHEQKSHAESARAKANPGGYPPKDPRWGP